MPYSRMDREIDGFMFTLKFLGKVLEKFPIIEAIHATDPHSYVTREIFPDAYLHTPVSYVRDTLIDIGDVDYILYPDAGAYKKYVPQMVGGNLDDIPHFHAEKERDPQTGKLLDLVLVNVPDDIKGKKVLIVDDLCVYGGTFNWAGSLLKDVGVAKTYLYVTHCENSIHDGKILDGDLIEKVFTTDSLLTDWGHPKLIKIGEFFND